MSSLTSVQNGMVRDRKGGLPLAIRPGEPFFVPFPFLLLRVSGKLLIFVDEKAKTIII